MNTQHNAIQHIKTTPLLWPNQIHGKTVIEIQYKKHCDFINVREDKFEFKNQKLQATLLVVPLLASNRVNHAINRALLTV